MDAKPKSSTDLRRLRNIRANPRVAVLADHYEDDWGALWWVRADGLATVLDEAAAMAPAFALLAARYPQYREQPPGGPGDLHPGHPLDRLGRRTRLTPRFASGLRIRHCVTDPGLARAGYRPSPNRD